MRNVSYSVNVFERAGHQASEQVLVPVEQVLNIRVNDELAAVLMRQPGDDLELATGYCLTEGLVTAATELLSARHCDSEGNAVDVSIAGEPPGVPCLGFLSLAQFQVQYDDRYQQHQFD